MWREFYKDEMKLGEYSSLKDIFSYRKDSLDTYKKLKTDPLFKKYSLQDCSFLTIEKENKVQAIIFFIKGFGHHFFFDYLKLDNTLSELIISQLCIMKFYETEESDRLHPLGSSRHAFQYEAQGFTTRSQIHLSISQ